jgi:DNA repair exonuclease SbcCD ATPase subunit
MLRISLFQFRCWDKLDLEIPLKGITLIRGNSGSGKTTIFHAITWALYGNIRLVAPNHLELDTSTKARTSVMIEIPHNGILTIARQRNPTRFIVTHNQHTYEDKVAQSFVDDLFGTYDIWLSSCYIGQGCRNSFLTAPNSGKMELLNTIAFHEEDPTIFIEKIDTAITVADTEYKAKLSVFNTNIATLTTLLQQTDMTGALSPEQRNLYQGQITLLKEEYAKLQVIKQQRDIDLGLLTNLKQQYTTANTRIVTEPSPDPSIFNYGITVNDVYETALGQLLSLLSMLQRRDDLARDVTRQSTILSTGIKPDRVYTIEDYQNIRTHETIYQEGLRLTQSLGVTYTQEAIGQYIVSIKSSILGQERLRAEAVVNDLILKYQMVVKEQNQVLPELVGPDLTPRVIPIPDYGQFNTTELQGRLTMLSQEQGSLQMHLQHLQKARDVIQCPQCNGSLRYQQGNLVVADTGPINHAEIEAVNQRIREIIIQGNQLNQSISSLKNAEVNARMTYDQAVVLEQRRLDALKEQAKKIEMERVRREQMHQMRAQQLHQIEDSIKQATTVMEAHDAYVGRLLTPMEVTTAHNIIAKLENLRVVDAPSMTSTQIQQYLQYQEVQAKYTGLHESYMNYLQTIPSSVRDEKIEIVSAYIEKYKQYWNSVRSVQEERIRLVRLKNSLEEQIVSLTERLVSDPKDQMDRIMSEINEFARRISIDDHAQKVLNFYNYVMKERETVTALNDSLGEIQLFRQYAVDTECRILQDIVDSINASIQSVCGTMFDRDININLSLFKTLKTSKSVKPVVNFQIAYQGGVFDNINQMSGGEGDRASLALTLALNKLSTCPILMLDESLASLDLNMKEAAVQTIHDNTNKTVIVIMHDGIEGIFDHVINVDELRAQLRALQQ